MISCRSDVRPLSFARSVFLGIASLLASPTWADEPRLYDIGAGFLAGAQLDAGAVYANNYFYEASDGLSASGYRIQPEVVLQRRSAAA